MSHKLRLPIIYLCISFILASGLSQAPDELKERYGAPDERGCYKVRPGVILTVSGQEPEQEYTLTVEPEGIPDSKLISLITAGQIIEELVPASRRGNLIMALNVNGSDIVTYEKATIHINKVCEGSEKCKVSSIKIKRTLRFSPREWRLTLARPFQRREAAHELFPSRSDG